MDRRRRGKSAAVAAAPSRAHTHTHTHTYGNVGTGRQPDRQEETDRSLLRARIQYAFG